MKSSFNELTITDLLRIHNFVTHVKEKRNFNTYRETFDYIIDYLVPQPNFYVFRHDPHNIKKSYDLLKKKKLRIQKI